MESKIAIDTNIFIYSLEDEGNLGDLARSIFEVIKKEKPQVFTSVLTIEEVLVGVYRQGLEDKSQLILNLFPVKD